MPEEPMAPEEPVYIPEPKTVAPETMKGLEKHATLAERITTQRMKELEELAGMDFIPHHAPQVGYEYVWEKGGKHYSLKVMMETHKPIVITNEEQIGGTNRNFEYHMRGNVLVWTNDWRKNKQVEKDPGATCFVATPDGKWREIPEKEFLDLVNVNMAKKRWYGPPIPW